MTPQTTTTDTNGSAPAEKPGLSAKFVARTLDLDKLSPSFGEMVAMEDAMGRTTAEMFVTMADGTSKATAAGMLGIAWVGIRRHLPDVTVAEVGALGPDDFGTVTSTPAKKRAGQTQG